MKKKLLLTISTIGIALTAKTQTLISENFDGSNTGNFATTTSISYATTTSAQNNWSINSYLVTPAHSYFQIESEGTGDNRLALTGSSTATGSPQSGNNYAQKATNWIARDAGKDVAYAECTFNTGVSSTSKNEFYFAIYDVSRLKCLGGYIYVRDTKVLKGLAYDSTSASAYGNYVYSTIGTGNASLVLQDNTDYYLRIAYDGNTGKTNWYVALEASQGTALCNSYRQNTTILTDAGLLVTAAKAGTSNASSSTAYFDNILVEARPCYSYTTQADADFSYTSGMHCIGSSDLTPALVSTSSTGIYSSMPDGLTINAGTGVINMTTSAAGDYIVKFITNNANTCSDSAEVTITITESQTPAFSIPDLICSGAVAPSLPLTSDNSISGTWTPSTIDNTISGTYTFTPGSGQCVLSFTKTINVVSNPVIPTFTIESSICTGASAPILAAISDNSVPGTWSPATVSNVTSDTYTFTPESGNCAATTTAVISVVENVTPTFAIVSSICSGESAPILETTSDNSITGSWLPSTVSNTATGTYTFTPASNECATAVSTTVTVNDCSGIEEENLLKYQIFPNPASESVSISGIQVNMNIYLISADGKIIEERKTENSSLEIFDVKSLKKGIYFFKIGDRSEKLIIN